MIQLDSIDVMMVFLDSMKHLIKCFIYIYLIIDMYWLTCNWSICSLTCFALSAFSSVLITISWHNGHWNVERKIHEDCMLSFNLFFFKYTYLVLHIKPFSKANTMEIMFTSGYFCWSHFLVTYRANIIEIC